RLSLIITVTFASLLEHLNPSPYTTQCFTGASTSSAGIYPSYKKAHKLTECLKISKTAVNLKPLEEMYEERAAKHPHFEEVEEELDWGSDMDSRMNMDPVSGHFEERQVPNPLHTLPVIDVKTQSAL
ncbi:hypothetical protein DXG03_003011, partial [Asterophora parasitica]